MGGGGGMVGMFWWKRCPLLFHYYRCVAWKEKKRVALLHPLSGHILICYTNAPFRFPRWLHPTIIKSVSQSGFSVLFFSFSFFPTTYHITWLSLLSLHGENWNFIGVTEKKGSFCAMWDVIYPEWEIFWPYLNRYIRTLKPFLLLRPWREEKWTNSQGIQSLRKAEKLWLISYSIPYLSSLRYAYKSCSRTTV